MEMPNHAVFDDAKFRKGLHALGPSGLWARHRAALVAKGVVMPDVVGYATDEMKRDWRFALDALPARYRGLLITLDYRQELMNGPPFSVPDDEVQDLYRGHAEAEILERSDILREEPKFAERGLKALDTLAYRLQGKRQG